MCVSTEAPSIEQVTNDNFTAVAGRWTVLDVLQNDKIASAGGGSIKLASQPRSGRAKVAGAVISYLPKAGALGIDSFNYTYVAKAETNNTAMVTLNITAGSCSQNMCGLNKAAGECDTATGRCVCPVGSRLEPVFAPNPSKPARNVTPEVRMTAARAHAYILLGALTFYWKHASNHMTVTFIMTEFCMWHSLLLCCCRCLLAATSSHLQAPLKCQG
jgi:hypothetical protein